VGVALERRTIKVSQAWPFRVKVPPAAILWVVPAVKVRFLEAVLQV